MAVYVDEAIWPWRGKKWAHLMADTLEELHDFAKSIGLQRSWFQSKRSGVHYDVTAARRIVAIGSGAVPLSRDNPDQYKAVIKRAKELYQQ